jgi:hypothetical protein
MEEAVKDFERERRRRHKHKRHHHNKEKEKKLKERQEPSVSSRKPSETFSERSARKPELPEAAEEHPQRGDEAV